MVAVSASTAVNGIAVAGSGAAQVVCVAKGVGMSIVLGAGAWGLVIFAVIATAATYDYLVRDNRRNGAEGGEPEGFLRSSVRRARGIA